jgi:hypothetical protein
MNKRLVIIAIALFAGLQSYAQVHVNSAANQNANLNLSNAILITFYSGGDDEGGDDGGGSGSTGSTVNIPFTTVSNYQNGVISSAQHLKVQSNKHFNVSIRSSAVNFVYTGTASPTPVAQISSVLQFLVSNNSTGGSISYSGYTSVPSSNATIISSAVNGGNRTFDVRYKANPGFNYPGGTYTANIIYTATQI